MTQTSKERLAAFTASRDRDPVGGTGHVFILNADIVGLAADAHLTPAEGPNGLKACSITDAVETQITCPENFDAQVLVYEGNLGVPEGVEDEQQAAAALTAVVMKYVELAATKFKELNSSKEGIWDWSKFARSRPLIALPFPSGSGELSDDLLVDLLPAIYYAAEEHLMDFAICTTDDVDYAMLQLFRDNACPWKSGPFWMLDERLSGMAKELADVAGYDRLASFFGAGVSFCAGAPSWSGLLEGLAKQGGFSDEDWEQMQKLDFMDQATLLSLRLPEEDFKQQIADAVTTDYFTPTHSLLAMLDGPAITTNYDSLFEAAAISTGSDVVVLPQEVERSGPQLGGPPPSSDSCPWLLKIHGTVEEPMSIVLTREDYLRYGANKGALLGMVAHEMIVDHVLIIGFSMTDQHLHEVIDTVRTLLPKNSTRKLGTILTLKENAMFTALWEQEFNVVHMAPSTAWSTNAAWYLDAFMDHILNVVHRRSHRGLSMHPKLREFYNPAQTSMFEGVKAMCASMGNCPEDEDGAATWNKLRKFAESLGVEASVLDPEATTSTTDDNKRSRHGKKHMRVRVGKRHQG